MSLKSTIAHAFRAIGKVFTATNLTAAEKWVAEVSPAVADDLMQISKGLPNAFDSLLTLAGEAKKLVHDVKGVQISTSLAVHLAQAVLTGHWQQIEDEAEALLARS